MGFTSFSDGSPGPAFPMGRPTGVSKMQLKYFLAASAASLSLAGGLAAVPAMAQQITTGIEGTVSDDAGNPIGGAAVTITDTRTGASRQIASGSDGRFSASNLVTGGPYTVSVNATGYEGQ